MSATRSVVFLRDEKVKLAPHVPTTDRDDHRDGSRGPNWHEVNSSEYFFTAFALSPNNFDAARSRINQAGFTEKPVAPGLHYRLAYVYAGAGRSWMRSATTLDRAIKLDPKLQTSADEDEDLVPLALPSPPRGQRRRVLPPVRRAGRPP